MRWGRRTWTGAASASALRRHAHVPVMQPVQDRDRDQLARPGDLGRLLLRDGRLALKALMRTGHVIVVVDEFLQESLQMSLAQDIGVSASLTSTIFQ